MMMIRMVMLESLQNPFMIPLLMNCRMDNPELISSRLPCPIQENETFIIEKRALFKIMRIVVRFVALRVRVLCQEMYDRSTSQNISWDLQPLQHQKSTVTHWWQCLTSRRAHVHDLLVKSLVTICRCWCSSPTNKCMTSLASAAIRNETLFHNLGWMQHSN